MKDYRERFRRIRWLSENYNEDTFHSQIESGTLDKQFEYIFSEISWLKKLKLIFEDREYAEELLDELKSLRERIIDYYIDYFRRNRYLGGNPEEFTPDLIIGLGCSNSLGLLDRRVERVGEIALIYPDVPILLSGGGSQLPGSEASIMAAKLIQDYSMLSSRFILEEDSMDTIGNALFSKLLLKKINKLRQIKNIILVTSPFHAVRAGTLFRNIFGQEYHIVVMGHPYSLTLNSIKEYCDIGVSREHQDILRRFKTPYNIETLRKKLAEQEIRSLYKTNELFMDPGRVSSHEATIFYELFLYHDVYRHRYDIIRKYSPHLETVNYS